MKSVDRLDLDILSSPVLERDFPGVARAFDEAAMQELLQTTLLGAAGATHRLERCVPGNATYIAGCCCALRYALELHDGDGRGPIHALVNGRVFPDARTCRSYLDERLGPLAEVMRGRTETTAFVQPVAMIGPLDMTVSVFPIDGELPSLVHATDPKRMLGIFQEALPRTQGTRFVPQRCRVELGHYGRQHRCVLRYVLDDGAPDGDNDRQVVVYGKLASDGRGALTEPLLEALRERVLTGSSRDAFAIPRSLGFYPELKLVLLESIPGVPRVAQLLKARMRGERPAPQEKLTLESAVDSCARVAALLHGSDISLGETRPLDGELAELRNAQAAIERVSPDFGARFESWLDDLARYAARTHPSSRCLSHGDFSYTQLIFANGDCGLVDFDTICQAEPALDLGHFLAYLRLARVRAVKSADARTTEAIPPIEGLCARFLDSYLEARGPLDVRRTRARVPVYELISLLRLAFHAWQKFKIDRLDNVVVALEDRLERLHQ
jgi:Phosphotransferase enzyme family